MARFSSFRRSFVSLLALAATAGAVALSSQSAHAVNEFQLALAPTARLLDAWMTPEYYTVLYDESCLNPILVTRARNKPAIRLENTGTNSPITTFTLKINEGNYAFGTGDFVTDGFTDFIRNSIYTDPGVSITSSSLSPDGKELTVNFNGLDLGKKAIFNVDLDATDGSWPYPDYRNVLFGAPLAPGEPVTLAASTSVVFGPPTQTVSLSLQNAEDLKGVNVSTTRPTFQNDNIRPYGEPDKMEIIPLTGQIPEPSSIALALGVGCAAVAAKFRLSRKAS